jgi:chromosome segregation ATPase
MVAEVGGAIMEVAAGIAKVATPAIETAAPTVANATVPAIESAAQVATTTIEAGTKTTEPVIEGVSQIAKPAVEVSNNVASNAKINQVVNPITKATEEVSFPIPKESDKIVGGLENRAKDLQEKVALDANNPKVAKKVEENNKTKEAKTEEKPLIERSPETAETQNEDIQAKELNKTEARLKYLEKQLVNLTTENATLKQNISELISAIKEVRPAIKALLEAEETREQDPKKKVNLKELLLMLAAATSLDLFTEGAKTVAPPIK